MDKDYEEEYRREVNKHWKVDWDLRIIYMSTKITNKDLIAMFNHLTSGEGLEKMRKDGPHAEWSFRPSILN